MAAFRRYIEKSDLFVPTLSELPPGSGGRFAITLRDGRVMIEGQAEVVARYATAAGSRYGRVGIVLRFEPLNAASQLVWDALLKTRFLPAITNSGIASNLSARPAHFVPGPLQEPPRETLFEAATQKAFCHHVTTVMRQDTDLGTPPPPRDGQGRQTILGATVAPHQLRPAAAAVSSTVKVAAIPAALPRTPRPSDPPPSGEVSASSGVMLGNTAGLAQAPQTPPTPPTAATPLDTGNGARAARPSDPPVARVARPSDPPLPRAPRPSDPPQARIGRPSDPPLAIPRITRPSNPPVPASPVAASASLPPVSASASLSPVAASTITTTSSDSGKIATAVTEEPTGNWTIPLGAEGPGDVIKEARPMAPKSAKATKPARKGNQLGEVSGQLGGKEAADAATPDFTQSSPKIEIAEELLARPSLKEIVQRLPPSPEGSTPAMALPVSHEALGVVATVPAEQPYESQRAAPVAVPVGPHAIAPAPHAVPVTYPVEAAPLPATNPNGLPAANPNGGVPAPGATPSATAVGYMLPPHPPASHGGQTVTRGVPGAQSDSPFVDPLATTLPQASAGVTAATRARVDLTDAGTGFFLSDDSAENLRYPTEPTAMVMTIPARRRWMWAIAVVTVVLAIAIAIIFASGERAPKSAAPATPAATPAAGSQPMGTGASGSASAAPPPTPSKVPPAVPPSTPADQGTPVAATSPPPSGAAAHGTDGDNASNDAAPSGTTPSTTPRVEICALKVTANLPGVEIVRTKTVLGTTPTTVELPCGEGVTLTFRKPHYASISKGFKLTRNASFLAQLAKPTFALKVSSVPPGASVALAGKSVGKTPVTLKVPAYAPAALTISKDGFVPVTQKVTPKANNQAVHAVLKKKR